MTSFKAFVCDRLRVFWFAIMIVFLGMLSPRLVTEMVCKSAREIESEIKEKAKNG